MLIYLFEKCIHTLASEWSKGRNMNSVYTIILNNDIHTAIGNICLEKKQQLKLAVPNSVLLISLGRITVKGYIKIW